MAHSLRYRDAQVNYYVHDVERMAEFYCRHFGFVESFRHPKDGPPLKIEVRLGDFALGFGAVDVVRAMHDLDINPGAPRSEIALWADDVDEVWRRLTAVGIRCTSPPHDFVGTLRAAWFEDPEGNHIQIVCRVPAGDARPGPASGQESSERELERQRRMADGTR